MRRRCSPLPRPHVRVRLSSACPHTASQDLVANAGKCFHLRCGWVHWPPALVSSVWWTRGGVRSGANVISAGKTQHSFSFTNTSSSPLSHLLKIYIFIDWSVHTEMHTYGKQIFAAQASNQVPKSGTTGSPQALVTPAVSTSQGDPLPSRS